MKVSRKLVQGALDRDEFGLVYQPIVTLESRETVGLEALVRWAHPTHGELAPGTFIAEFERSGAIADLGVWVSGRAMTEAAVWHQRARNIDQELYLSVNVSGYELQQIAYGNALIAMCDDFKHRCQDLRVEVIESEFDLGGSAARSNIERLRREEIRIMVDDFGIGASNVHRIIELTADAVKLDMSLIADVETNSERRRYLGKLASVAANAGVEVIAEGIERESQLRILLDQGFQFGQGFLFARPVPATEVEELLHY